VLVSKRKIKLPITFEEADKSFITLAIRLTGLNGGHSANGNNQRRGNAIKSMGRFLWT